MATVDEQERNVFRDILKVLQSIDAGLKNVAAKQEQFGTFMKEALLVDLIKEIQAIMNHPDGFRHFYENGLSPENRDIESAIKSLFNKDRSDSNWPLDFEHYFQKGFTPQHRELMARLDLLEARCCPRRQPDPGTPCYVPCGRRATESLPVTHASGKSPIAYRQNSMTDAASNRDNQCPTVLRPPPSRAIHCRRSMVPLSPSEQKEPARIPIAISSRRPGWSIA